LSMALPPGATMAVTGTYANTPSGTCKARICSFFEQTEIWAALLASIRLVGLWVYLTCTGSRPSMGATEGEWLRIRSREPSVFC
jgi:hypothetical protein